MTQPTQYEIWRTGRWWRIEAFDRDVSLDGVFLNRVPTGFGEGSCACGWTTTVDRKAARVADIPPLLLGHIEAEHPDWPAEVLDHLRPSAGEQL